MIFQDEDESRDKQKLILSEKAEWQYSEREKEKLEVFYTRKSSAFIEIVSVIYCVRLFVAYAQLFEMIEMHNIYLLFMMKVKLSIYIPLHFLKFFRKHVISKINIIHESLRITGPTEATELPACSSNAHQMPGIRTDFSY